MEEDLPIITATSSSKNTHNNDDDGIIEFPLPGFRFHPTDQELVGFYLKRKVFHDQTLNNRIDHLIKQLDIYKYDPWDLPKYFGDVGEIGHKEWYFFCKRGRKYKNSIRPNRVTGSGFWKATGIDRQIMQQASSSTTTTYAALIPRPHPHPHPHPHKYECIGLKKSLVYYRGNAGKGVKTDWMMHEFRLPSGHDHHLLPQEAEVWTLCRILKRDAPHNKYTHANAIELGITKKDNMKSINNNSSNNIDFMNVDNKSFISFTSPTPLIKAGQNEKKRHLSPDHLHHHHQITASDHQLMNSISDDNPSDPSYANFHNSPEMDIHDGSHDHDQLMIKYANWDELRHVVEYFDPYHV